MCVYCQGLMLADRVRERSPRQDCVSPCMQYRLITCADRDARRSPSPRKRYASPDRCRAHAFGPFSFNSDGREVRRPAEPIKAPSRLLLNAMKASAAESRVRANDLVVVSSNVRRPRSLRRKQSRSSSSRRSSRAQPRCGASVRGACCMLRIISGSGVG